MKYRLGLDIGSTTLKAVLLDGLDNILYRTYRRHRSDVQGGLMALFEEIALRHGDKDAAVCLTGSAGLGAAAALCLPFVQEVMAGTKAVMDTVPDADVVIELGGEDAKITFFKPVISQRMNGTCAGGTGAFIDQMAALLQTDADGLNDLAALHKTIYRIASRCGVFAKSDLQPLINEGVSHPDLAASVLQAVVNQTIAGLACGQAIIGTVVFLGGPLTFMPELRAAFERTLQGKAEKFINPQDAEVFVALGAAKLAQGDPMRLSELPGRLSGAGSVESEIPRMPALFGSAQEYEEFKAAHARYSVPRADISQAKGPCWLGIDAGSTTIKSVLLDSEKRIIHTHYTPNQGNPLLKSSEILNEIYTKLPAAAHIGGFYVTGYGEALLRMALRADGGEIETLCHARAAAELAPDVEFILDIGGQDMKCMRLKDGTLDSVLLNEACSSGCGSFIQTFAESLGLDVSEFARRALESENPVDLGTRCTVFMNSRVKQAQKEGATVGDISCGLSYSVIRNALYKVIKLRDADELGKTVLVQGGTFLNDAVLRCFEKITGRRPIRPDIAGLMGAYGAAIIASENVTSGMSAVLTKDRLDEVMPKSARTVVCQGCTNACKLTVSEFSGGRRLVSGHRCEKGEGKKETPGALPNLAAEKYMLYMERESLPLHQAPRGIIGIPRALNMFENYPLWHTMLTKLGFSVVLSRPSDHGLFEEGMSTIPSESVCYPAKLAHGHVMDLLNRGVKTVFYPCVTYERKENENANNHFNCPIVQSYPEVLGANVDALGQVSYIKPFISLHHRKKMAEILAVAFKKWGVTVAEARTALNAGFKEMDRCQNELRARADSVIERLEREGKTGIVLAGRPYHMDPEVHHGVPDMISALGFAVLTEDSVSHRAMAKRPLRVFDQWMYHTRLYDSAEVVAAHPNLQMVQLNSFGCGLDAVTTDQVQEILQASGKIFTVLKIDEISSLGAARIRIRSLAVALGQRRDRDKSQGSSYQWPRPEFTAEMRGKHTVLAPQMSPVHFDLIEAVIRKAGYNIQILKKATKEDIETGLRYVNNDACYPTIVVVGQLMNAILSGQYDPDNTSIFLTQTGGGCRATNYVALLRRALRQAGFPQVPVVSISVSGIEKNEGLKYTLSLIDNVLKAIVLGDLLQMVLLRTRPYEKTPGSANRLFRLWMDCCTGSFSGTGDKITFSRLIDGIIRDFEELPLLDIPRKPRVGLVGEILVKFHPDANNNAVAVIEREGCEAVVPGLLGFLQYCFLNSVIKHKSIGTSRLNAVLMSAAVKLVYGYENMAKKRMKDSKRFHPEASIEILAEKAGKVLSTSNQCGEGWLLTAEMLELIENGVPNIICAQPFACLPNHVTGKGMIRKLREMFPQSNIVPVDYDPGASEVNQLNRIKLMISAAFLAK